ncbi:MAG: hypothetical protein ACOY5F_21065 [Pseudomonadota bacterium]
MQALAIDAELAGAAMACRYGSSDEYEAELIAERRRAGLYRGHRRLSVALWGALASAFLLSIAASL